jgi:MFS family permease
MPPKGDARSPAKSPEAVENNLTCPAGETGRPCGELARLCHALAAWPPLGVVMIVTLLAQVAYAIITPTLPLYLNSPRLGAPIMAVGLVFAVYAVTETFFKAIGGALGDQWGKVRIMVLGLVLGTISPVLMTVAPRWEWFVPLRGLDGLGVSLVWPTIMALIGERVPAHARATAMAAFNLPYMGGLVLGMAIGLEVGERTGSNAYAFYMSSLLLLLAAIIAVALGLWERRRRKGDFPSPRAEKLERESRPKLLNRSWWQEIREANGGGNLLLHMFWVFALMQMAASMLAPILTIFARDMMGLSQSAMVRAFILPGLVAAGVSVPLGHAADRLGRVRMVLLGLGAGAAGLLLVPYVTSRFGPGDMMTLSWLNWTVEKRAVLFSLDMTMLATAFVAVLPSWMAITSHLAPAHRQGLAIGAMNTAQGLGLIGGTLLGAFLYEQVHQWAPFLSGGLLLLGCCVATALLFRRRSLTDTGQPAS